MGTSLTPRNMARSAFVCWPMLILLMLAIPNSANAQGTNKDIPLSVEDMTGNLALYNTITLQVKSLEQWVNQPGNDPSKFILYIDGSAFKGLPVSLVDNNTRLQFDLKRTTDNKDAWTSVLSRRRRNLFYRNVGVTVGYDKGPELPSTLTAGLIVINETWFKIFVVSFLATIGLFWWLAYKSDVLRAPGDKPEGTNAKGKPNRKPYSLARTQMAFWFFVVIVSYIFIWMVTSDLSSLTTSVLGLIGISAATGLGAAAVDSNKQSEQQNQLLALKEEKQKDEVDAERLAGELKALTLAVSATPPPDNLEQQKAAVVAKQAELAAKQKEIQQGTDKILALSDCTKPAASKRFINDILSDDNGISFHRFQIFAWTIALIFVFVASVCNGLTMPDFDGTLLALMGISGGTYIGFKLPDKQG